VSWSGGVSGGAARRAANPGALPTAALNLFSRETCLASVGVCSSAFRRNEFVDRDFRLKAVLQTQLTKRRRRTLIASPRPKHVATTDVEPKLIRGSGIPIIGKSRMTIPTLTVT
jgi:hypothetical protein